MRATVPPPPPPRLVKIELSNIFSNFVQKRPEGKQLHIFTLKRDLKSSYYCDFKAFLVICYLQIWMQTSRKFIFNLSRKKIIICPKTDRIMHFKIFIKSFWKPTNTM